LFHNLCAQQLYASGRVLWDIGYDILDIRAEAEVGLARFTTRYECLTCQACI
jgi:hypothetical protein